MIRVNHQRQLIHLVVFVLLQIPLIHKFILFDVAFGFFYVGFVLFLPLQVNKSLAMIIGFFTGLLIDVFSSTPGIHAAACVLIAFVKDYWYAVAVGDSDEDVNISWNNLKGVGSVAFLLPLLFIHHSIIFIIENDGLGRFLHLFYKIGLSSIYSFIVIFFISLMLAPKERAR